jgi:hypothetical protein
LNRAIGTLTKFADFFVGTVIWRSNKMPIPRSWYWTADDIAKLKDMAQKHPTAAIAAEFGRTSAAVAVKANELKLSLRIRPQSDEGANPFGHGA